MMAKRSTISIIRDMLWLTYMMIQEIMSLTTHRCCVTFQASGTCSHVSRRTWLSVHYGDVIMGAIASQITSLTIVYSSVYSDADQRKYQSSAPLAFVRGIHRRPVNSPHKWPVTRKCFHLMTSSWYQKRNNDTTKQHTDYAKRLLTYINHPMSRHHNSCLCPQWCYYRTSLSRCDHKSSWQVERSENRWCHCYWRVRLLTKKALNDVNI